MIRDFILYTSFGLSIGLYISSNLLSHRITYLEKQIVILDQREMIK